ncbi:TonB-dependent receptor [Niveispirillum fermenti]|uniref:TonB-dependent receptor n=1 Tax=Niveispirillum fermenti TaxID=1233113 RepID=UPI003A891EE8
MRKSRFHMLIGASTLALGMTGPTMAQTNTVPDQTEQTYELTEIIVTARKRAENIMKTPVSVTAVTAEEIEQRGIASVQNLSEQTPGFNINNNFSGRGDRSFQQLILRGFTPATTDSTPVATFIDGVPVSSPTAVMSVSSPERIELLRGPQSAYFGRNTFAGALNVVNKQPGNDFSGSVTGMIGTHANRRIQGELEGPLVEDKLAFRIAGDYNTKDGTYKNYADRSQTLGDQSSRNANLLLVATPSDNLTIKAFGLLSRDKDGPAALGLISATAVTDSTGRVVVPGQANCVLGGFNPFMCGKVPSLPATTPAGNYDVDSFVTNALATTTNRLIDPDDSVDTYGLVRDYRHAHLVIDYEIPDSNFMISSLTGYNHEEWASLSDIGNYDSTGIPNPNYTPGSGLRSYFSSAYLVENISKDFSQEIRTSYDDGEALRFVAGLSYLSANGRRTVDTLDNMIQTQQVTPSGKTESKTYGGFFGVTYDITDKLTASVEGRYQIDKLYAYISPLADVVVTDSTFVPAGTYAAGSKLAEQTYKNFLPRLIAQYEWTDDVMTYASVARGVNPASLNSGVVTYTGQAATIAKSLGIELFVKPEKVTTYELGLKGTAVDNRLRYSVAAYYSQWRDQLNQLLQTYVTETGGFGSLFGTVNSGNTDMKGLEFDSSFRLTSMITLTAAGALNDSKIKDYSAPLVTFLVGSTDFSGNELPATSKYSAAGGVMFNGDFAFRQDASWFARIDYNYKSGVWADVANVLKTRETHIFNARAGATIGAVSFDVFANNLFDSRRYTTVNNNILFTPAPSFTYSTVNVGLRDGRTLGIQAKYKF